MSHFRKSWKLLFAAAAAAGYAVYSLWPWLVLAAAVLAAAVLTVAVYRFARLPAPARRYWLPARWHKLRWRRLARNLNLSYTDRERGDRIGFDVAPRKVIRVKARFRPVASGMEIRVKATNGVGRVELERHAGHLADAWKAARVSVSQPKPGRLVVRAHRKDPLLSPLAYGAAPVRGLRHLYLGRDEHGQHRWADIANCPGITVGGVPGSGKSTEITSWLAGEAPSDAVQFALLDGKGAGEFDDFAPRAWLLGGDDLDEGVGVLEKVHEVMTGRLSGVRCALGSKNMWHQGPSPQWPLIKTVLDECQTYLDLTLVKGDKNREPKVRRCIELAASLVRKGRSVGMLTVFGTQKPTTDSLPSAVRDNCPVSLAFALKTMDAAKATLGQSIADFPSCSPLALQGEGYAGCCTASLRTGQDPFTRLRAPWIDEATAARIAEEAAHLRRDPAVLLTAAMDAAALRPVAAGRFQADDTPLAGTGIMRADMAGGAS